MKTTCPTCKRAPSVRWATSKTLPIINAACPDPIHDLADQLVDDLFAQADELGIPRDAATVREAVRRELGDRGEANPQTSVRRTRKEH